MVKTPCAHDKKSGQSVFAPTAVKKRKYACLECEADVVVHRGPRLAPHFTHLVPSGGGGCGGGGESALHLATKEWIKSIANDPAFVVWTNCTVCLVAFTVFRGRRDFDAKVEHRWMNGKFVMDVAIASPDRVCAAVEVWHTHEAGATKRKTIEASDWRPLPVMEVKAVDLVAENWPRRFECFSPRRCSKCLLSGWKAWWETYGRQNRIDTWLSRALVTLRKRRQQRAARARALELVRIAEEANELRFAAAGAASCEIAYAAVLDDLIDALVEKTASIGRRWLFTARCRTLASRIKKHCLKCGDILVPTEYCKCELAKRVECETCLTLVLRTRMRNIRMPQFVDDTRSACLDCVTQCACNAFFIVSPQYPFASLCFYCNYRKKNGHTWGCRQSDQEGECKVCGTHIFSTRYGGKCYNCNTGS